MFEKDSNTIQKPTIQAPWAGKLYIGTKLILAEPMDEVAFLKKVKGVTVDQETRSGYHIIYPDGYESWSPKDTFETAYRLVTSAERKLF